jgi:hypothetical protein
LPDSIRAKQSFKIWRPWNGTFWYILWPFGILKPFGVIYGRFVLI